jgi:hypothetical protein
MSVSKDTGRIGTARFESGIPEIAPLNGTPVRTSGASTTIRIRQRRASLRIGLVVIALVAITYGALGTLLLLDPPGPESLSLSEQLSELNAAILSSPDDVQAIARRAEVKAQLGDLRGAIQDHTHVIAHRFIDPEPFAARAASFLSLSTLDGEDRVELLIRVIEDCEAALGRGGDEWAGKAGVEALQNDARHRLDLILDAE